eukprot:3430037-Amphidinium_carterae.1
MPPLARFHELHVTYALLPAGGTQPQASASYQGLLRLCSVLATNNQCLIVISHVLRTGRALHHGTFSGSTTGAMSKTCPEMCRPASALRQWRQHSRLRVVVEKQVGQLRSRPRWGSSSVSLLAYAFCKTVCAIDTERRQAVSHISVHTMQTPMQ